MSVRKYLERALRTLKKEGILMEADNQLPSLATLITGGKPIKGSWWSHKKGNLIYNVGGRIYESRKVVVVKLVSGKVTYLHRRLAPAFLSIVTSREPWQMAGLTPAAKKLLKRIERTGEVRADRIPEKSLKAFKKAAKQLEDRLLVRSGSIHTETGAHAKTLTSWEVWAKERKIRRADVSLVKARARLEEIVMGWNQRFGSKAWLPWQK